MRASTVTKVVFVAIGYSGTFASAQALLRGPREVRMEADGKVDSRASLRETSLFIVEAPKPKTYAVHDLITIIISENSKQSSQQILDTKKDASLKGALNKLPDLGGLINNSSPPLGAVDVTGSEKYKGDAKYQRTDDFKDKISAEVIDVKPNGTLVLEAKRIITKDKEVQSVVLSGACRREDVTSANTILSAQLADLTLTVQNQGELRNTNEPGWITRLFRAVFDF